MRFCATAWVVASVAFAVGAACQTAGGPGTSCTSPSDCEPSLQCLYTVGAGCDAQGLCDVPPNGCLPGSSTVVLCGCGDMEVDTSCIGDNATLAQPTATGSACPLASDAAALSDASYATVDVENVRDAPEEAMAYTADAVDADRPGDR